MVLPLSSPVSPKRPISPCTPLPPPSNYHFSNGMNSKIQPGPENENENDFVIIDSNTEEGIIGKDSGNALKLKRRDETKFINPESGTKCFTKDLGTFKEKEEPILNRRISLSGLISPPIKLKALVRRLSNSSPPEKVIQIRKSSPASPNITPSPSPSNPLNLNSSTHSSTMPVVPPITTSTVLPTVNGNSYPAVKQYWTEDIPTAEDDEESLNMQTKEKGNRSDIVFSPSNSSTTLTALDEDAIYCPSSYVGPVPRRQPSPPSCSRRAPFLSRNSSFADDLTSLREVDESLHHDHSFIDSQSEPITPTSPNTKSSSGIWLCSPPATSSKRSLSEKQCTTPRFTSRPVTKTKNRPVVVRSMSTGRLASEFDSDGRVICLSVHSDRILKPTVSSPPASSCPISRKIGLTYRSTPRLLRSQSYQVSKSTPTSPIEKPSSGLLLSNLPIQPSRTISDFGKQSSTERLVNSSGQSTPSLTRTLSVGSWKKKAWSIGRSVRV